MAGLTDAEWRGARVLAALLMLGTLHDLWEARHPRLSQPLGGGAVTSAPPSRTASAAGPSVAADTGAALDLNRADAGQLDALPGIGPVLARRIVEYRSAHGPFQRLDELLAVPGIGPRLLERLRGHLREPSGVK